MDAQVLVTVIRREPASSCTGDVAGKTVWQSGGNKCTDDTTNSNKGHEPLSPGLQPPKHSNWLQQTTSLSSRRPKQ
jgi:hypothetical protein